MPTAVIHGTEDEVVPLSHGKRLHAAAAHKLAPLWLPGAGHNDLAAYPQFYSYLADTLQRIGAANASPSPSRDAAVASEVGPMMRTMRR
jgi:fermentation-respiration switch protein FrsA (DUF1100 family)|eukprot:COSAG01_NODE_13541_length_1569_cov_15.156463_1_plen_89_part_00